MIIQNLLLKVTFHMFEPLAGFHVNEYLNEWIQWTSACEVFLQFQTSILLTICIDGKR